MLFKNIFYRKLILTLVLHLIAGTKMKKNNFFFLIDFKNMFSFGIESNSVCIKNETVLGHELFVITFDAGPEHISNKSPLDFGFDTDLPPAFESPTKFQTFGIYNKVPNSNDWHKNALDHTENDTYGYMYLVDFNETNTILFNFTVNDLCAGLNYEFSVYLANVQHADRKTNEPKVRFKVQTTADEFQVLSKFDTNEINAKGNMTWIKYGLSFIATNESIDLLMISDSRGNSGNDLAIDDISLRVCYSGHISYSSKGFLTEELVKVCYDHDVIAGKILLLITFGSGVDNPSKETPCSFNFSTSHTQILLRKLIHGTFTIANEVFNDHKLAQAGALDHTMDADDNKGYMIIIDLDKKGGEFFRTTFTELCLGIRYEVSVYMVNVHKKRKEHLEPNIRLEIRTTTSDDRLLAELPTRTITSDDVMIWHKLNLSFVASSSSVFFLMISNPTGNELNGNDLAIDDIQLKVSDNALTDPLLLSVTFDSGTNQYSNKSTSYFGFRTTYEQVFGPPIMTDQFALVNSVPNHSEYSQMWHINAHDHTLNDGNGYMYLVDAPGYTTTIFEYMINALSIGVHYEFSAYLANLFLKQFDDPVKPSVLFEIRSATKENLLLAQLYTDGIPDYDEMTWLKYSLSFIATSHTVMLHIISVGLNSITNDLAIDDIEFCRCPTVLDCISPLITLIPNSSVDYLQFRQNQDIFISSKLEFHQEPLLFYQWTIFSCSPICSNEISLPNTTNKDLMIQSHKLSVGRYELRLTVNATINNSSKFASVSSIFIEILTSHINTNLVPLGRLNIKHHSKQNLLLDPGNFSTDPIKIIFFAHVSQI